MSEQLEKIKESIEKINNKDFGIYFFTIDTKGNPTAGVATIYEHVKKLRELGYNAQILMIKMIINYVKMKMVLVLQNGWVKNMRIYLTYR